METENPFNEIEFNEIQVPEELKTIIIHNIESVIMLMELSTDYNATKRALALLFKTDIKF